MSRAALERTLGKLVMDANFREAFFRDPVVASRALGIELTESECSPLARIPPGAFMAFRRYLDGKWASGWLKDIAS
jgi:hypothetical protein